MASVASSTYFQRTSLFWMVVITLSMGFFTWTVFWPKNVPYQQLGPVGSLALYMVENHYSSLYYGFWAAWTVHVLEASYSLRLCSSKGITDTGTQTRWLIQTFLFGIASLSLLLKYKPAPAKKRR
ncbi:transmembrane protein 254 [Bombina bombina]|uniref:transmembrane protein 254 n=1 Tax=Bombina bombina TaxID=8345 RepID=UPI00235AE273|nr:transmembrane protein 254 [Bombina bombina]